MSEPRYMQQNGLSGFSAAVDEIYALRAACAAAVDALDDALEQPGLASFRREHITEVRAGVLRGALGGDMPYASDQKAALRADGADDCLTNQQFADQRGLIFASEEADR